MHLLPRVVLYLVNSRAKVRNVHSDAANKQGYIQSWMIYQSKLFIWSGAMELVGPNHRTQKKCIRMHLFYLESPFRP